jgi:hypothetical protein
MRSSLNRIIAAAAALLIVIVVLVFSTINPALLYGVPALLWAVAGIVRAINGAGHDGKPPQSHGGSNERTDELPAPDES